MRKRKSRRWRKQFTRLAGPHLVKREKKKLKELWLHYIQTRKRKHCLCRQCSLCPNRSCLLRVLKDKFQGTFSGRVSEMVKYLLRIFTILGTDAALIKIPHYRVTSYILSSSKSSCATPHKHWCVTQSLGPQRGEAVMEQSLPHQGTCSRTRNPLPLFTLIYRLISLTKNV